MLPLLLPLISYLPYHLVSRILYLIPPCVCHSFLSHHHPTTFLPSPSPSSPHAPSPQSKSRTHISSISEVPDKSRERNGVRERDESGALGPAEVLVAVRDHVCLRISTSSLRQHTDHWSVASIEAFGAAVDVGDAMGRVGTYCHI